jgi:hypothetical protein
MDKGRSDPKPKDPKPAGAVGYDPKPFVPLRDSAAQPLVKGFLREREGEREEKRSKDQKLEKERRKEGRKEGRKRFSCLLVFDLERALRRRDVDLKKGWSSKGREGKKKKVFEFWLFWPVFH